MKRPITFVFGVASILLGLTMFWGWAAARDLPYRHLSVVSLFLLLGGVHTINLSRVPLSSDENKRERDE